MKKISVAISLYSTLLIPISLILSLFLNPTSIQAHENFSDEQENTTMYVIPEEEIQKNLLEDAIRLVKENEESQGNIRPMQNMNYEYKQVETKYGSATGYPGNQPAGGVYYKDGGSIFWTPSGGPNVSVSVSFSNGLVSVGIGLGARTASQTIYSVNIPAGNYYRVRVTRKNKVVKTAVYGSTAGPKKFLYYIYPQSLYSIAFTTVRVN